MKASRRAIIRPSPRAIRARMVKELDLSESWLRAERAVPGEKSETDVTQRYTVQNWCVTSSQGRSERVGPSPMISVRSSIFDLTTSRLSWNSGDEFCPFAALLLICLMSPGTRGYVHMATDIARL